MNTCKKFILITSDTFKPLNGNVSTIGPPGHYDAKNTSGEHPGLSIVITAVNISEIHSMSQTLEIQDSASFFSLGTSEFLIPPG